MLKSVLDSLDVIVGPNAERMGVPYDQIKYMISLVVTIMFSIALRLIRTQPGPRSKSLLADMTQNKLIYLKHALSIFIGVEVLLFLYHDQIINSFVSSLIVWCIMQYLPPAIAYKVAVVFSMLYMLGSHIYIMTTAYMSWAPDFTAPQMVLTIKMTAYAFAVHDGVIVASSEKSDDNDCVTTDVKAGDGKEQKLSLTPRMKEYCVRNQPNIVEFFGWTYFAPGLLAGPAVEYADYAKYVDGSMFASVPGRRVPFSVGEVLKRVLYTAVFLAVMLTLSEYGYSWATRVILDGKVAENGGFAYLSLRLILCGTIQRSKYYVAWMMGEIACLTAGISFSGMAPSPKDPSRLVPTWNKGVAAKPLLVEFGTSCKVMVDNWNIGTEKWLRYYVNDRLVGTKLEGYKRILTYLVSAFWHGLYPGYYFFFVAAGTVSNIAYGKTIFEKKKEREKERII